MAQRVIGTHRLTPKLEFYDPADELVLKRMKWIGGLPKYRNWERLNWYVLRVGQDLANLTDG